MGLYSMVRSAQWLLASYPADRYNRFLQISEHWSREQLEDYRNDKLRKLIFHCYEHVPYYRRVMDENKISPNDIKRAEDIVKLPVLTKDLIRTHSKDLISKNVSNMRIIWTRTGGTTGEPMHVCKNIECSAWGSMCYERGLRWGGLKVDEPRISLFGGSLGIDKTRLTTRIGNLLRRDLFLPAFELRSDTAKSYFDRIIRSKCRFLVGYSSAIYRLSRFAEEMNYKLELSTVFPTAELMLPEWKELIREVFKCNVMPYYGCGEINSLGYYTLENNGYVIPEEHALIEIMQEDDSTSLIGEGRFIITDLDNYAMPIMRYINGDAGKISISSDTRFPFSIIERLDGRYNSYLMTEAGDLISGAIGPHIFRHFQSVKSYKIIQEEPLRIVIEIVPKTNFTIKDEEIIIKLLSEHIGNRVKIVIKKVSNIPISPSGKHVFVINKCI